jgi:hypothetical protein
MKPVFDTEAGARKFTPYPPVPAADPSPPSNPPPAPKGPLPPLIVPAFVKDTIAAPAGA